MGAHGAILGQALLARVGDLCAGAADEALNDDSAILEDLDPEKRARKGVAGQARAAMAAALAGLGPQAVLAVLPLDLDNVSSGFRLCRVPNFGVCSVRGFSIQSSSVVQAVLPLDL